MKLKHLTIKGYKNLNENAVFEFSDASNYGALIGLNGSGKSNVIEAISIIFSSLYLGRNPSYWNEGKEFKYRVVYQLADFEIEIIDGIIRLLKERGIEKNRIIRVNKQEYLPTEVMVCYSGDESRLWDDIYARFYFSYLSKISKGYRNSKQKLVYLNKYSWEFALLVLLCHERSHDYLKSLLNVSDLATIGIRFHFAENYDHRREWFMKNVEAGIESSNDIVELLQRIKTEQEAHDNELVYTQISSIDIGTGENNDRFCRKLFYLLFAAGMPREKKLFKKIEMTFNELTLKHLSEGEKKIILIKCIMDILCNENSIILLDEPDSHIHISRKIEIEKIINKPNLLTILTTHSPTLLAHLNVENTKIVSNGDNGLEVIDTTTIKPIEAITEGAFTLMDATLAIGTKKDILLVEGENDYLYIHEAVKRLNKTKANKFNTFNFLIINCGGAGNVPAIFREIILPHLKDSQLCIATFDGDKAGKDGITGIKSAVEGREVQNVVTMTHTPLNGWDATKEFFMEDYFPVNSYKSILIDDINRKSKIKDFHTLSKDSAKDIIKANYLKFNDADYNNFEVLLDEFVRLQTTFHNP